MGRHSISDSAKRIVRGRSGGWCEVRWADGCTQVAESMHHLFGYALGGRNNSYNLVDACNWCHVEVHRPSNEAEAVARGLIRTSKSKASKALAAIAGADAVEWMQCSTAQRPPSRVTPPVRVGDRVVNVDAVDWRTAPLEELMADIGLARLVGAR